MSILGWRRLLRWSVILGELEVLRLRIQLTRSEAGTRLIVLAIAAVERAPMPAAWRFAVRDVIIELGSLAPEGVERRY